MASISMNLLVTILFVTFGSSLGKTGCQTWCRGAARPWETKCMWSMACGGCDECAPTTKELTTLSPTTKATTKKTTIKKTTTVKSTTTTITTVSTKASTTTSKTTAAPSTPSTRESPVVTTTPETSMTTTQIITTSKTKLSSPTNKIASPTNNGALKLKSKEFTSTFSKNPATTFKTTTSATPLTTTVTILKSTSAPEIEEIASVNKRCNTPKLPEANTNINASETAVAIEQLAVEIPCPENNAPGITSTIESTSTMTQSVSTNSAEDKDGPKSFWDGLGGDTDDDTLLLMLSTLVGAVIFFLVLVVTVALICSKRRSTVRRSDPISIKLDRTQFDISFSDEGYDDGDDYESDHSSQYSV